MDYSEGFSQPATVRTIYAKQIWVPFVLGTLQVYTKRGHPDIL